MNSEWVLDASVLAKCLFEEQDTEHARAIVFSAHRLMAPDFIFVEFASIAAKKVRRGHEKAVYAAGTLARAAGMAMDVIPATELAAKAFELAVSVYDGLYLALVIERDRIVLSADMRLVGRSGRVGLGRFVQALSDA